MFPFASSVWIATMSDSNRWRIHEYLKSPPMHTPRSYGQMEMWLMTHLYCIHILWCHTMTSLCSRPLWCHRQFSVICHILNSEPYFFFGYYHICCHISYTFLGYYLRVLPYFAMLLHMLQFTSTPFFSKIGDVFSSLVLFLMSYLWPCAWMLN